MSKHHVRNSKRYIQSRLPRLLIVGHRLYAELLAEYFEHSQSFRVVGTASDLPERWPNRHWHRPDLWLADPSNSVGSLTDTMQQLVQAREAGPIAILTAEWSKLSLKIALEGNLNGYLLTDDPPCDIIDKLQRIDLGERCFSDQIERELLRDPNTGAIRLRNPPAISALTQRELMVLQQLVDGHSVKQVAASMEVTYKAIDSVKYRIMQRLGIRNRVELVRYAIREGLAAA